MKLLRTTPIHGLLVLGADRVADERGDLAEVFHASRFEAITGHPARFVQENHTRSHAGVLRGLHLQRQHPQGKLVRVLRGTIWDVAVDLRGGSATHGQWFGLTLDADAGEQLWVPPGLAHGFLALTDCEVLYRLTAPRVPSDECVIAWDDPEIGVAWPLRGPPLLSPRDRSGLQLAEFIRSFREIGGRAR